MNYKLLFPTYRSRYRYVSKTLQALRQAQSFPQGLNLGCGEGDYDPVLLRYVDQLTSCDINEADIDFARSSNQAFDKVTYQVEDACQLSLASASVDLIVSTEVIEHVGSSEQMMVEIGRVLKPNGVLVLTFPSIDFPFTYDPINRILSFFQKKISLGAYAFGHDRLIDTEAVKRWASAQGLELIQEQNLGNYLVGLTEMYWVGICQSILKPNANNLSGQSTKGKTKGLRPSHKKPYLTVLTDALIQVDDFLFGKGKAAVCKGMVFRKKR